MAHDLPSARHLADLHGFFKQATFNADGTANLVFKVPPEMKAALLDISVNDGMALNLSVWETRLPEGDGWLAEALGLPTPTGDLATDDLQVRAREAIVKVPRGPQS